MRVAMRFVIRKDSRSNTRIVHIFHFLLPYLLDVALDCDFDVCVASNLHSVASFVPYLVVMRLFLCLLDMHAGDNKVCATTRHARIHDLKRGQCVLSRFAVMFDSCSSRLQQRALKFIAGEHTRKNGMMTTQLLERQSQREAP